jgi:cytochrome c553
MQISYHTMLRALVRGHVIAAVIFSFDATAADVAAGQAKAAACGACHGVAGISSNPMWPNLAGQQGAYLVKQLKAFRSGTRQDPLMTAMAKTLSDEDIENLAAYFSQLPPK